VIEFARPEALALVALPAAIAVWRRR